MGHPTRFPHGLSTATKGTVLEHWGMPDPTKYVTYWNDFTDQETATADWIETLTGTTPTFALTDIHGGGWLLTTTGAENDGLNLQTNGEFWLPAAAKKFWYKTRFKMSDATQSDFLLGVAVKDTTLLGAAAGDGVTDGVFFQKDDGAATVALYVQKDTTTGQLASGTVATLADDTFVDLGYYYDGARYLKYYLNDAHVGTLDLTATVTTYLPDTECALAVAFLTGAAAVKTMTIDYILFSAER